MSQDHKLQGYLHRGPKRAGHQHRATVPQSLKSHRLRDTPSNPQLQTEQHRSAFDTDVDSIGDSTTFDVLDDDSRWASDADVTCSRGMRRSVSKGDKSRKPQTVRSGIDPRGFITAAQLLGEAGKVQYEKQAQAQVNSHLLTDDRPVSSRVDWPTPASPMLDSFQGDDSQSSKDEHSNSPTPRRRPIVIRSPLQDPKVKPPPPAFPVTHKRARDATAQAFADASNRLHDEQQDGEADNPFIGSSKLNRTVSHVSDISVGEDIEHNIKKNLDYGYDELSKMPFTALAEQPFDSDPQLEVKPQRSPPQSKDDIAIELLRLRGETFDSVQAQRESFRSFFAQLDIAQHEEAGDFIMERLTTVLNDLKQIRRDKRAAATEIEAMVAKRELLVRGRQESLARSTDWLKKQGQGVIQGRK